MGKTVFTDGAALDITLYSEPEAALLLVSVDTRGNIDTITAPIAAGAWFTLPQASRVEEPCGTDFLKLFAFPQTSQGLEHYARRTLDPATGEVQALLTLIQGMADWATTRWEIVTVPRP